MHPSLELAFLSVQVTLSRSSRGAATGHQPAAEGPATERVFPGQQIILQDALRSPAIAVLWSSKDLDEISDADVTIVITITDSKAPCNFLDIASSLFIVPSSPSRLSFASNPSPGLRVLDQSLDDGISFDTKFLTNSKRLSLGNTCKPLPTYAHSAILQEVCPKLAILFPCDFASITEGDLPLSILEDYDYGCDSDIDDDDDEGIIENVSRVVPTLVNEVERGAQPQDTGSPAPSVTRNEYGDIAGSNRGETVPSPSPSADSITDLQIIESASSTQQCRHEAAMQLIQVKCAAHRTWRAFVYYCYTGQITFYPLRSQMPRNRSPQVAGGPPLCSPKSMYRLADKASADLLERSGATHVHEVARHGGPQETRI
ncbi:hypothetical protein BS17DRAFT_764562 [Gyrodon lividus]|nr:hypothetical protein BS17DRAFT_764562 [Gyrodon lividus]